MSRFDIAMVLLAVVVATMGVRVYQWLDVLIWGYRVKQLKKRIDKLCNHKWPFP